MVIRCAKVIFLWSHKLPALQKFRRPIFGSLQLSALAVGPCWTSEKNCVPCEGQAADAEILVSSDGVGIYVP